MTPKEHEALSHAISLVKTDGRIRTVKIHRDIVLVVQSVAPNTIDPFEADYTQKSRPKITKKAE